MAVALTIIMWVLVAALVAVVLVLVTPIYIELAVTNRPKVAFQVHLRALGGLAPRIDLTGGGDATPEEPEKRVDKPAPKQEKRARRSTSRKMGRLVRAVPDLLRDILRHIHFDRLQVDCDYGLGDPADTGQLTGTVLALTHGLPPSRWVTINARPNFDRRCFEGEVLAVIHLTVAAFVWPALRFAWRGFGPSR